MEIKFTEGQTKEQDEWEKTSYGKLSVSKNYFHHHANKVLNTHIKILDDLQRCFDTNIPIQTTIRNKNKKATKGISADDLNVRLRDLLRENFDDVKFEVFEDKGVFYFSSKKSSIGGFDFAFINHEKNLTSLRNLCFGELSYTDSGRRWESFLKKNQEYIDMAQKIQNQSIEGIDTIYEYSDEHHPLVVGEIQFGNWALVYRDFFKVLKANVQNSIDCLVYVVPTGNLESMLSDGIVTYDGTVQILKDFEKVISVPIWVIGLDLDVSVSATFTL